MGPLVGTDLRFCSPQPNPNLRLLVNVINYTKWLCYVLIRLFTGSDRGTFRFVPHVITVDVVIADQRVINARIVAARELPVVDARTWHSNNNQ